MTRDEQSLNELHAIVDARIGLTWARDIDKARHAVMTEDELALEADLLARIHRERMQ